MNNTNAIACTICEEEHLGSDGWFLLTENEWMDRLKILAWDDLLATQGGVHCLCSTAHVQELVAHWMATGSLHYPFARLPIEGLVVSSLLSARTANSPCTARV